MWLLWIKNILHWINKELQCTLICKSVNRVWENEQDQKSEAQCDLDKPLSLKPDHTDHRPRKHRGSYITRPQMSVSLEITTAFMAIDWCDMHLASILFCQFGPCSLVNAFTPLKLFHNLSHYNQRLYNKF